MSLDRGVDPPELPKTADEVRRYQWRVGHLTRWLEDSSNADHKDVMFNHVARSAYLEALRLAGYPTGE